MCMCLYALSVFILCVVCVCVCVCVLLICCIRCSSDTGAASLHSSFSSYPSSILPSHLIMLFYIYIYIYISFSLPPPSSSYILPPSSLHLLSCSLPSPSSSRVRSRCCVRAFPDTEFSQIGGFLFVLQGPVDCCR